MWDSLQRLGQSELLYDNNDAVGYNVPCLASAMFAVQVLTELPLERTQLLSSAVKTISYPMCCPLSQTQQGIIFIPVVSIGVVTILIPQNICVVEHSVACIRL